MIHNKYFEIMKHFLRGYNKEIYGRELTGKVNISQKNIALTMEEMESEGILISKTKGTLRHYSLNKSNSLINKYLLLAEVQEAVEFLKKNPKINQFTEKLDKENKIICIFGSYTKGLQKKNSDLDLFIIGNFNEKKIEEIGEIYGIRASIKGGSMKNFVDSLKNKNPLMNEILESHILISGYEEFICEVIKQRW